MLEQQANIVVHINENLDQHQLHKLEDEVRKDSGISRITYQEQRPHLMVVFYDPESTRSAAILNRFSSQGMHAQLIGL